MYVSIPLFAEYFDPLSWLFFIGFACLPQIEFWMILAKELEKV